ncbi:MAG: DUF4097 family beta strand repeat-containing protein [Acidobacteriota bacterium]
MKKLIENLLLGMIAAVCFAAVPTIISAQATPAAPLPKPEKPAKTEKFERISRNWRERSMGGGDNSEKSIKADASVNLSLCVTQGSVKVNGWNRSEVRVFVQDGSKFAFKVQLKSPKSGDPALLAITGIETKNKYAAPTECIWGSDIEIDVPVNATINIKGQETTTMIDTVRKAGIRTIGGDISLRNVSSGVTASAGQGDITVEESEGPMILESTTGNILVFEAGPSEIGDMFRAKTNSGSISLQRLGHRQIEVNSISGSVAFNGEIQSGGSYSMSTSRGSIRVAIPAASNCHIVASYGYGNFSSEIPIKIETENITEGPIKTVVGKMGSGGEALLKLATNNGSIGIKKLQ